MKEIVLDASFALRWCFEDEATEATDRLLSRPQNQEVAAWVPGIYQHEMLNGLGKGVSRGRLGRDKAILLWQEIQGLPVRTLEVPVDYKLLDLALHHDLAVYDASYLSLALAHLLPIATGDGKLQHAAKAVGLDVIAP